MGAVPSWQMGHVLLFFRFAAWIVVVNEIFIRLEQSIYRSANLFKKAEKTK
jgi:hypothetical protein